jgi:hypothetical protein
MKEIDKEGVEWLVEMDVLQPNIETTRTMKASELRIGNLIHNKQGNIVYVNTNHLTLLLYGIENEFNPISLTEEWLLKFGFAINRQTKEENNIWRCYSEEGFFEVEQIGDGFFLDDNQSYGTQIDWVHQLQNLFFALTRDELKQQEPNISEWDGPYAF